ncbi:MAG: malate dehydrogenase [Thioalkalispiraceae bacterium]|jgi:malate dehydrogenase
MAMNKVAIIGAGQVGYLTAQKITQSNLCSSIALVSRDANNVRGLALDIEHAASMHDSDIDILADNDYKIITDANVIVLTAGQMRHQGMSRLDLVDENISIVDNILNKILEYAPGAYLIMVTNPVDVLTYYAWKRTGWSKNRIMGLSCVLDSARMNSLIAKYSGFSVKDISSMVIGGHGDSMVPLPEYSTINGIPIRNFISNDVINNIIESTKKAGTEIIDLKKSSGYVAASSSIVSMINAIMNRKKMIVPCVGVVDGEYGIDDAAIGLPMTIGENGIDNIVQLDLTESQRTELLNSSREIKQHISRINNMKMKSNIKPVLCG